MATLGENHKYLVLAVNNRLDLLQFNLRLGENFDLSLLDSKAAGSLLNVVKTVGHQVLAGDIMKGLTVFDVREIRNQVELWEGPSSPQSNIWVNDIVILSPSKYLVCDKERNLIIFERKLKPVTELETFKLQVVAQVSAGEEVTAAVLGTMSVHAGVPPEQKSDNTKEKVLKRREKKQESKEDVEMLAELE